jgi:outer membrane assembly lipoprotein YfiO
VIRVCVLALALLVPAVASAAKPAKAASSPTELYEKGLRQMKRGYFTKALEAFNRVRNYHRDDPLSVKSQLAIAEVYYKKGDYEQARFAFEEFAAYHPRHEDLDYVTRMIGMSVYKRAPKFAGRDQTATRGAVNVWTGFDTRFPESDYAEDVIRLRERGRNRLAAKEVFTAKFYARRNAWGSVRGRAEYGLRRYAGTSSTPKLNLLLGTAMHAWGHVDEARGVLESFASASPESRLVKRLERRLARPAGEQPEEEIFVRPYRIRGVSGL